MSDVDARMSEVEVYSLPKGDLDRLLVRLHSMGYETIGPKLSDGAIVYSPLSDASQIPVGWLDEQDGGRYRLFRDADAGYFDYVVGPHSLKPYVFPPREPLVQLERVDTQWEMHYPNPDTTPLAILGVRSCDLHALAIQDRVFLDGPYQDPNYRARRERLFQIAIQCRRAVATCFCHSFQTGPRASGGFDLALTELNDVFLVEVGTKQGSEVLAGLEGLLLATVQELEAAQSQSEAVARRLERRSEETPGASNVRSRSLDTTAIRELLLDNLEHPRWDIVADRCLSCANCTMVCPTCFCSSVQEVTDLTGEHVTRERHWDSCFTADHSRVSAGVVRATTKARYRQWLTHKLATWIDQYGTSGCVGCGRCITWCPVGIDLTEEVAAIRGVQP